MVKWLEGEGADKDVVVSSRVRIARNVDDIKFPHMMNIEHAVDVIKQVRNTIEENNPIAEDYEFYRLNEMTPVDRMIFAEKHLISSGLSEKPDKSAFLLRKDENVTIMINEEDHIRMQSLLPGLELEKAWDLASKIDDLLEEKINFAFDEKLGYLTTCPTNIGTGIRASVMVHLPCLVLTKQINSIIQAINQIGLTVRGLYGEGTNAMGNIFQISNQTTLGETEDEIIQKLENIISQIIGKERISRDILLNRKKIEIEDRVLRSLGVLKNARILSSKESMQLLSYVKMGIEMDIIKNLDNNKINNLMISTQPAGIQEKTKKQLSLQERDITRANMIREKLKG